MQTWQAESVLASPSLCCIVICCFNLSFKFLSGASLVLVVGQAVVAAFSAAIQYMCENGFPSGVGKGL